jgi:hypothetical protein
MNLLVWHLKCTKDFSHCIHVLQQNVTLRDHIAKNGDKSIKCVSTHVIL